MISNVLQKFCTEDERIQAFGTDTPTVVDKIYYQNACWEKWNTTLNLRQDLILPLKIRVEFGLLNFTDLRSKKMKVASPEIKLLMMLKYREYFI
jgi:hypothetical protein